MPLVPVAARDLQGVLYGFIFGFWAGFCLQATSLLCPSFMGKIWRFLWDVLYWSLLCISAFLFFMVFSYGRVRAFLLVFMAAGFWLYFVSLGPVLARLCSFIRSCLQKFVQSAQKALKKGGKSEKNS